MTESAKTKVAEESFDCLIVGAGISGLLAGITLAAEGLRVCILEKGRGLGGRMATRRNGSAVFDHGAQLEAGAVDLPGEALGKLRAIRYRRCIAALAILEGPSALIENGGSIKLPGEPVQWIADNQRKGISPSAPAVTIHSTPAFAEEHWNVADFERIPKLLAASEPYRGARVASSEGQRWGFSAGGKLRS